MNADDTTDDTTGDTTGAVADHPTRSARAEEGAHDVHAWVARLAAELGVDPDLVDVEAVLDLARETAHGVARPAVPLTGFFLGYAVAAGARDRAEVERVAARITDLARAWAGEHGAGGAR